MDDLQTRLDTLEQQVQTLTHHTHTVNRRLRWWRGLAGGLLVLAVLTWALPLSIAQEGDAKEKGQKGIAQRVAALERLLKHFSRDGNEVFIKGANLHIVNGLGHTDCGGVFSEPIPNCPNGLGNLIVGYNESRGFDTDIRTGSHNVVVGQFHNFSRFGGIVAGQSNTISGDFAVVSGGQFNTASGNESSVSGGQFNTASGQDSSVSGGASNEASGPWSSVSGGGNDPAFGTGHTASGRLSSVSGGFRNTASGELSSVSGGGTNTASGLFASVSGGLINEASGDVAAVSGGANRTAAGYLDWVAGSFFEEE